jgi:ribosomal protein S18 acetylase RimI-like enzyme
MSPNLTFTIEKSNWRDLSSLRRLEQECFPEDAWPLWDLIGVLTLSGIIRLKAICRGEMVGFVAGEIKRPEKVGWISTIGTLESHRRAGIGTALLAACEKQLAMRRIRLCVRTTNQSALRLYDKLGYIKIDTWHHYYSDGADAFILEKLIG